MDKQQQQKEEEKEGFSLVSLDESFFFYDSLVRRVWVDKREKTHSQGNRLTQAFMHVSET